MDSPATPTSSARKPITALAMTAAKHWPVTLVAWLAFVAAGIYAFVGGLDREGFPPVNVPIVVVDGTYFVGDPELVDLDIAQPLDAAFQDVEGVSAVQSFALDDAFAIIVEFESDFSSPEGAALLESAGATVELPTEAQVTYRSIDATKFLEVYDVLVSVSAANGATSEELEAEAATLAAFLEQIPEVEKAEVRNLLTEGVDPATGDDVIRQTRFTRTAFQGDASFNNAIAVGLIRSAEAEDLDILSFSDAVNERLDQGAPVSAGFEAAVTADFAVDIRNQIRSLQSNLLTGLVAVAIVSLILISWRTALVTAAFMATVILAALVVLWVFGYSLNTITLFALILTLGLLVDDAIVISESIDANRGAPGGPLGVVKTAIDRVGSASFAGTATTVLVFAPMLFVSGILGEFIRVMPITVIITLLLSFVFSIVVISAMAGIFLLRGRASSSPVVRAETAIGDALGRLASLASRRRGLGIGVGIGIAIASLAIIVGGFMVAGSLGFNIFPASKDSNALLITADFPADTTIEEAQEISDEVDDAIIITLGEDMKRAQYIRGNERLSNIFIDLVPFDDRSTTAPTYVERLEATFEDLPIRTSVSQLDAGPPVEDFPFAVQIAAGDQVEAGEQLATDIATQLKGREIDKGSGTVIVIDTLISTEGQVFRSDGVRQVEVRAAFDDDDLTANLNATEDEVKLLFPPEDLAARGLAEDAMEFDFGQESSNEEDFASLNRALLIALGLMLVLLVVQFRSVVQPLLIFLAIPFALPGVFSGLSLTDNPISFFVMVGLIGLIGVVVNNTILLTDAANQARRAGESPAQAIGTAVSRRFRPLVATTVTTVAGLIPLTLSDPFWESLSVTIMAGLISSTFLVLLAFPVYYLAVEAVRTTVRNAVRRRTGRQLV